MQIDSSEVRSVARKLSYVSSSVRSVANGQLRQIQQESVSQLEGLTANALEDAVAVLRRDIISLASGLSQLSQELHQYANRIQQADAQASSFIGGR